MIATARETEGAKVKYYAAALAAVALAVIWLTPFVVRLLAAIYQATETAAYIVLAAATLAAVAVCGSVAVRFITTPPQAPEPHGFTTPPPPVLDAAEVRDLTREWHQGTRRYTLMAARLHKGRMSNEVMIQHTTDNGQRVFTKVLVKTGVVTTSKAGTIWRPGWGFERFDREIKSGRLMLAIPLPLRPPPPVYWFKPAKTHTHTTPTTPTTPPPHPGVNHNED